MSLLWFIAAVSLVKWLWLLLSRGGFWRADQRLEQNAEAIGEWPPIVAVIPARDEAETIYQSVSSLSAQDYPGDLAIIVVDDNSSDATAALALKANDGRRHVEVVSGEPLLAGWTGKMWAVSQGVARAREGFADTEYLLLTDADIYHDPTSLRRLVSKAEKEKLDLVSLMVLLQDSGLWERFLSPAFVFFFQKLYPFRWVNDPENRTAGAAGGCMLVRSSALDRIGGIKTIRQRVIDDCALAMAIKPGGPIWLGLADASYSIRGYDGLAGFWNMVARTAFVQLQHSWLQLFGTVFAMLVIYCVPPVATILGFFAGENVACGFGLAAWAAMSAAYLPTLKLYKRSALEALFLPVLAVLFTGMTIDSALRSLRGGSSRWKGRTYDGLQHSDE